MSADDIVKVVEAVGTYLCIIVVVFFVCLTVHKWMT